MGVRDFAGGIVVHLTCGVSALILAIMIGARQGFPNELKPPHNPGQTMIGASMLWVGWFGFNAGSALAADGAAGMAMLVTHIAAATASLTWMSIEWAKFGKPSVVGIVTGMVAGLATITPASGYVGPLGALIIGVAAGAICQGMTILVKQRLRIDDSLDVFAVHGIGGILGSLLLAVLAAPAFGGLGLEMSVGGHLGTQVIALLAVAAWTGVLTFVIAKLVGLVVPPRVAPEIEMEGLDLRVHGERGYDL
jgi:Amt family ammonium transporter